MKKSIQYFIILLCFYCNADIDQLGDKLKYLGLANSGEFEAPTVLLITPISEAKSVSVNEEVSVLFSQPMDKNSVETGITIGAVPETARFDTFGPPIYFLKSFLSRILPPAEDMKSDSTVMSLRTCVEIF